MSIKYNIIFKVIVCFILCSPSIIRAQISVTPYIGLNLSKLANTTYRTDLNYSNDYSLDIPTLSIEARRKVHKIGFLGLSMAYRKSNLTKYLEPGVRHNTSSIKYDLKYLDIGLTYRIFFYKNIYSNLGLNFSYLINESREEIFMGQEINEPNSNYYPKRDLGIKIGAGYELKNLDFRLSYYLGLSSLDAGGNLRLIQFDIGYRIIN
jgi:hypothetical protein